MKPQPAKPEEPQWPATVKRYCLNRDCPSFGRKYADRGRFICRSPIGAYTVAFCHECNSKTIYNPPQPEETAVVIQDSFELEDNV